MASTEIERGGPALVAHAEAVEKAALLHPTLLVRNTPELVRADKDNYEAKQAAWVAAKRAKVLATGVKQNADADCTSFVSLFVGVHTNKWGRKHSPTWEEAGFQENLAMPDDEGERYALFGRVKNTLTARPELQVEALGLTVEEAAEKQARFAAARTSLFQALTAAGIAKAAREMALTALRHRMSGVRDEIDQSLEDDDPRWWAFDFNRPSDPNTPETPLHLIVTPGAPGSGMLILDWDDSRRATGYRLLLQLPTDEQPQVLGLFHESEAVLRDLPTGAVAKLRVLATNKAGDSQPGTEITVTVP